MDEPLVDLPAPSCRGTYFALFEPEVVQIGTSTNLQKRLERVKASTFRQVVLLAWSDLPEKMIYRLFREDRLTDCRGFFRLSPELFGFINKCRETLGFSALEEVQLWEFGGPLPQGTPEVGIALKSSEMSYEEKSKLGRYYTHLRWHSEPKPTCEFCSNPQGAPRDINRL